MQNRRVDLADLLVASGSAMGSANLRLRDQNAPALLQEFSLAVEFQASLALPLGACTVLFGNVARQSAQQAVLFRGIPSNVQIEATYIAAPSLVPAGGVPGP